MLRWLATNLRTFLLALALGITVWVIAVNAADPDETQTFPSPVPVEFIGQDPGLILTSGNSAQSVQVTARAPHSIWQSLLNGETSLRAVADLTGLAAGRHTINIQVQIDTQPVRILSVVPTAIELTLEPLVTRSLAIELSIQGSPAIGFEAGNALVQPRSAVITGAESVVSKVSTIQVVLDLGNTRQNIDNTYPLEALDSSGETITGLTILPAEVKVSLPIVQQGGYRDLAVKVMTVGNPASGYSLSSVAAFPPIVTIYSADSATVDNLPGYVETTSLDLSGAKADMEKQLGILLPPGVTLIGDQSVLVKIGIAPIESSRTISFRPVELIGLSNGLKATVSPQTVDIILSGPLPALDALQFSEVRVQVDLTHLQPGTYQLTPVVSIAIQGIKVESILPGTVQVTISAATIPTP